MILEGVLYSAGGPLASVCVIFRARKTSINGVVQGSNYVFKTDEDGSYFLDIEPGYYDVTWTVCGRAESPMGSIIADADSEMSLPQALEAAQTPVDPSYVEDILSQIQTILGEVIVARDDTIDAASDAADSAQSAASSATVADDRASDASDSADSAAASAGSAATSAQTAGGHADDAAAAASTASNAAQDVLGGNYVNGGNISHIVTLSLEDYDALNPPDPNTMYVIEDA